MLSSIVYSGRPGLKISRKRFAMRMITMRYFVLVVICMTMLSSTTFSQLTTTTITRDQAFASLKTNRDRLLASYATRLGYMNASQVWSSMSPSQKGAFLTITDYLGRRMYMHINNNYQITYVGDQEDRYYGCASMNNGSTYQGYYWMHPPNYSGGCTILPPSTCLQLRKCQSTELPRTDHDMVLNHVTTLYAVNGSNGSSCGGEQSNRLFFSADAELIYLLRNISYGLPGLGKSSDPFGPHNPFTQSREGIQGQPRGQTHQWAWDYQATVLNRPGVYGVYDPQVVEMDIDYNALHDSNTECYYNNTYGRTFYENYWYVHGLYGSAELNYSPPNN